MSKVFVHGNPETTAVWRLLVDKLADRGHGNGIVLLSPPGFGAPVPAGWEATPDNYADWLVAELEALVERSGPVDIVGHDWGAGHVFGALARRPDLIATWATDIAGLLNPEYGWHEAARLWQTPEVGEQVIEMMTGVTPEERAERFVAIGMDPTIAGEIATSVDEVMGQCILTLYRGAVAPYTTQLADRLEKTLDRADPRPRGLVIDATADAYIESHLADSVVERFDADRLILEGAGHFWMMDRDHLDKVSDALVDHWAGD